AEANLRDGAALDQDGGILYRGTAVADDQTRAFEQHGLRARLRRKGERRKCGKTKPGGCVTGHQRLSLCLGLHSFHLVYFLARNVRSARGPVKAAAIQLGYSPLMLSSRIIRAYSSD